MFGFSFRPVLSGPTFSRWTSAHLLWKAARRRAAALGRAVGLAWLVGLALLVAGCDQAAGPRSEPRGAARAPVQLDSAVVSFSHMPTGTSLPDPAEVGPGSGIVRPGEDENTGGGGPTTRTENEAAAASPYGCYLASWPFTEEVRFRSVYLRFPAEVVKAAGAETERFTYAAREGHVDTSDVRYAHCVIPEATGARALAQNQIVEAEKKEAAAKTAQASGRDAQTASSSAGEGVTRGDNCFGGEILRCGGL